MGRPMGKLTVTEVILILEDWLAELARSGQVNSEVTELLALRISGCLEKLKAL